ncbi:MAG: threonine ammonia-lyase [Clostridia bacterium]
MIEIGRIEGARERIAGILVETPVVESRSLGEMAGGRLYLKAENLQKTGSFKARGAVNRIRLAAEAGSLAGVVTGSSGNHGQAVAFAAARVGVPAYIVVPTDATQAKVDGARAYRAEVEFCGTTSRERLTRAAEVAEERGYLMVPPYDDPEIMAGQGTIGLELLEQVPDVDTVLVPIGGGGLISGIVSAIKARRPSVRVIGVEPAGACAAFLSHQAGRRVEIPAGLTIADGLRTVIPGALTFPIIEEAVDQLVTVSDEEIRHAMRAIFTRAKMVVEPSGACAAAYALRESQPLAGNTVVAVMSGGNVDVTALASLLQSSA